MLRLDDHYSSACCPKHAHSGQKALDGGPRPAAPAMPPEPGAACSTHYD